MPKNEKKDDFPSPESEKKDAEIQRLLKENEELKNRLNHSDPKSEFEQFLLNQLMENVPDIIYFKDIHSRFIKVSHSFVQKHNLDSAQDALLKSDYDIFTAEHAQKAFKDEQKIMETGSPMHGIEEKETHSDSIAWASSTKLPLKDSNGRIMGTFGISRDITDKKEADEALRKSEQELRVLNATKDKFFSIIAHDLKNPFNAIIGYSRLAKDFIRKQDYQSAQDFIEIVAESSDKAMELLENLLGWAQSQRGQIEFKPKKFKISPLLNNVLSLFKASLSEKSITVENKIASDSTIFADDYMLKTIFRNLISNAVKFSNTGGKIIISEEKVNDKTLISIEDEGEGVDPDTAKYLFDIEKHTNINQSTRRGTGLGLILCKEFTDAHGGDIWIESKPDRGTIVSFKI